ncbi:MAG: mannose-1-phosphate guanylyltransferase/mannose-6-phosphate isomerase [Actinobacteria bacterium RBG_16_64_13]|nr:MAG: mannose-1-phosphate guanylyltransferase/mannose-6-phosphate isomerase [Actinobacteria bacterium RBG_16_64_13]
MIQPVILAGGSGTRLWPASRQNHPKQLLAFAGPYSLLQETALRARDFAAVPTMPNPVVLTNEEYRFVVADQLREIGVTQPLIVLEPVGRNTAPALTVAALLLADGATDPVLLVMASDHLIKDVPAFHAAVAEGAGQAEAGMLVTFGITPDRPETGYGYIRTGGPAPGAATARLLAGFTEKPDAVTAEHYLASGDYLWNSGIFMVKRSVWMTSLERHRPEIGAACRAAVANKKTDGLFVLLDRDAFAACPSDSIDCAVMERVRPSFDPESADEAPDIPEAVVVPLDAGWSDVGGWAAIWSVSAKDEAGNVVRGDVILEDTRGTLVHADSRLVTVLGAENLVVVETADAVLVAAKDKAHDLKRLVAHVQEKNQDLTIEHRRVHRPWGRFDSIDSGERFQVKRIVVSPGASLSLQLHRHRAEHWVVVHGIAEVTCGDRVFRLGEDESTYVPLGTPHRLANPGTEPLEIIEVQSGDYLGEDDIVRLEDSYGRLEP